jgi:signal transduction histidine kinase
MAVPLRYRDDVLGVMRVDHQEADYFDAERVRLLTAVSSQAALAMRHARLQEQQREVAVALERNRIARDLHDAVSQTLFAANVMAGSLASNAGRDTPPPLAQIQQQAQAVESLNRSALAEMRLLLFELRPDALKGVPLGDLLQHAAEAIRGRGEIEVEYSPAGTDALPPEVRVQFYRIAQEALSNVLRHSAARHCSITWAMPGPRLALLRITDDGAGFDPGLARPGHFGLENMRSRAAEIGATLRVTSTPGQGTAVQLEWPEEIT